MSYKIYQINDIKKEKYSPIKNKTFFSDAVMFSMRKIVTKYNILSFFIDENNEEGGIYLPIKWTHNPIPFLFGGILGALIQAGTIKGSKKGTLVFENLKSLFIFLKKHNWEIEKDGIYSKSIKFEEI